MNNNFQKENETKNINKKIIDNNNCVEQLDPKHNPQNKVACTNQDSKVNYVSSGNITNINNCNISSNFSNEIPKNSSPAFANSAEIPASVSSSFTALNKGSSVIGRYFNEIVRERNRNALFYNILDDNCNFTLKHTWSFNVPDYISQYQRLCLEYLRDASRECLDNKIKVRKCSCLFTDMFYGNLRYIPRKSTIAALSEKDISELSKFPILGFVLDVNLPALEKSDPTTSDYSKIFDPIYSNLNSYNNLVEAVVFYLLRTNGKAFLASFGVNCAVFNELKKMSLLRIKKAIWDKNIQLKFLFNSDIFESLLFLARNHQKIIYKNLKPETAEETKLHLDMLRKDTLENYCTLIGKITKFISHYVKKEPYIDISNLPGCIQHELIPLELLKLGFATGDVSRLSSLTLKITRRIFNKERDEIIGEKKELNQNLKERVSNTRLETTCHKMLLLNITLLLENVYSIYINTNLVFQRKFIESCELYLQMVTNFGSWLGFMGPHQCANWKEEMSNLVPIDFMNECSRNRHEFVFPFQATDDKGNCPFCRKHKLVERQNHAHWNFFKKYEEDDEKLTGNYVRSSASSNNNNNSKVSSKVTNKASRKVSNNTDGKDNFKDGSGTNNTNIDSANNTITVSKNDRKSSSSQARKAKIDDIGYSAKKTSLPSKKKKNKDSGADKNVDKKSDLIFDDCKAYINGSIHGDSDSISNTTSNSDSDYTSYNLDSNNNISKSKNILNLVNSVSTDLSCNGDNDAVTDVQVVTYDVKDNLSSGEHAHVQARESEKRKEKERDLHYRQLL